AAEQEAAAALAEERLLGRAAAVAQRLQVDLAAAPGADRGLAQGAGEAAVTDVVGGGDRPGANGVADDRAGGGDGGDLRLRQSGGELPPLLFPARTRGGRGKRAEQGDRVALAGEGAAGDARRVGQLADHSHH